MRSLVQAAGLHDSVRVESAGTAAYHAGELPDRRSRAAASSRQIELSSRARQFTSEDWARFDYVLAMDRANFEELVETAPDGAARAKLSLLRAFDPASRPGAEVPDPYSGGPAGFEEVLDLCEAACAGLLEHLRREHRL